jgi:hypothetical protein
MTEFKRGIGPAMAVLAFALAGPAGAQENLDQGKSGAQLYAADCAICHKTLQALGKSGGMLGLSSFLREHYTASRESADMIATYLQSFGNAPASSKPAGKRKAKADDKGKPEEKKSKPGEAKSDKPDKPAESKASGAKTEPKTEPKSDKSDLKSEPKTSGPKLGDAKPDAAKPAKAKTGEPKPDKPQKPD